MDEREKTSGNIVSSGETFKIYYYQTSPGLQISSLQFDHMTAPLPP